MTQSVAAVATEVTHWLGEISDNASSGMHLHDIGVHTSIIPTSSSGFHHCDRKTITHRGRSFSLTFFVTSGLGA
jgi:hypothetical protein